LGIDKVVQKRLMQQAGFAVPRHKVLLKRTWQAATDKAALFKESYPG
jgi:D-alanine-D-alanine ligase-like ATP-grasp enzyme